MIVKRLTLQDWQNLPIKLKQKREIKQFKEAVADELNIIVGSGNDSGINALTGIEYLSFDTDHFGIKSGRLLKLVGEKNASELPLKEIFAKLLSEAAREGFLHITVKVPSEDVAGVKVLEELGFQVVICNLLLTRNIPDKEELDCPTYIRQATLHDLTILKSISSRSFPHKTRFHLDPHLSNLKSTQLYELWIENILKDEKAKVWCAEIDSQIAGFITCQMLKSCDNSDEGTGYIDLISVDDTFRGRGIGSGLIKTALNYLKGEVPLVTVDTESINYSALRLYQKNGFIISGSRFVLNKWLG